MSQVEAIGVTKRYGRTVALDRVGLALGVGVTGLLGPNAAGKTTLLRILSTALEPDEGALDVLGNDPATSAGRQSIRRRLGYLPQELSLPRGFTTFGFVDYLAILKDWKDRDSRHAEVRRVIDLVGLTDVAAKRVHALSGGQRRRVVIAQALLGRPRLLVLDEPTTGLDPAQRALLRDVLSEAGRAAVVLLSTHQTDDVAALCERVIVLADGRVRHDGPVDQFVTSAAGHVWQAADRDPNARHAWRTGGGIWRHVGDPPPRAQLLAPSLEDAYLLLVGHSAGAPVEARA